MLMQVSRWHLIGVIIVTVLCSLSEGIGLALLLPTLQVAGLNLAGQGEAGRYAAIVSHAFLAIGLRPSLIVLLGIFVTLVGVRERSCRRSRTCGLTPCSRKSSIICAAASTTLLRMRTGCSYAAAAGRISLMR